jgi:hypothetical protein
MMEKKRPQKMLRPITVGRNLSSRKVSSASHRHRAISMLEPTSTVSPVNENG